MKMLEQIKPCYGGAGDGRPIVCDRERPTLYRHPTEEAPDETTILNVRHLRECQGPGIKLLERINEHPGSQGLKLKKGTIMDAGIASAPSSTTKSPAGERDCETKQSRKRQQWHFGMKLLWERETPTQG